MKYRGGARGVNEANWDVAFLQRCRQSLSSNTEYAAKYDATRRFNSSMVSVVRVWISKQRSQASNSVGAHQAARSNPRKPTTTGAAGGTPEGPPSRDATPVKGTGKRAEMAELRDRAFGRSHMVHKLGSRQSLNVRLPPRVPRPSGDSSRAGGARDKGKGKASAHDLGSASVPDGDGHVGDPGTMFDPSPDLDPESDVDVSRGGGAGNTPISRTSRHGAGGGEGGAGSSTGVERGGPGKSRGSDVGGSGSGRILDGGVTPTMSDQDADMDDVDGPGAEDSSEDESPGERDRSKRGRAPAFNPVKFQKAMLSSKSKRDAQIERLLGAVELNGEGGSTGGSGASGEGGSSGGGASSGGRAGTDIERVKVGLAMLKRLDDGLSCPYTVEDCNKFFE